MLFMCLAYTAPPNRHEHLCKLMLPHVCHVATCMTARSLVYWCLQAQLSNAELTGSVKFLQEELAAATSANTQLQTVLTDKQQSWHGQSLSMQAEHEKQVYDPSSNIWHKCHLHSLHNMFMDLPGSSVLSQIGHTFCMHAEVLGKC